MQIVGYDSGADGLTYDPATGVSGTADPVGLLFAEAGSVRRIPLAPGTEVAYTLDRRHCVGTIHGDTHGACDESVAPYCASHDDPWPCASCRGQCSLPIEACREDHAIYLAAFAPATFKVGVTRLARLPTRLREQGADRGAHLQAVSNGRLARRIEAELATDIPDRVPVDRKVAGLHRSVLTREWEALLADYDVIRTFSIDYELDLSEQPVRETLLTGTVIGAKGRLLVLERGGGRSVVDLRDLVGYDVRPEATDREVQSHLGIF